MGLGPGAGPGEGPKWVNGLHAPAGWKLAHGRKSGMGGIVIGANVVGAGGSVTLSQSDDVRRHCVRARCRSSQASNIVSRA